MPIAHQKLEGLDRERVVAAIEPVLAAHGVDGVELIWRTDRGERVLELTLERSGSRVPGAGITIDLCSEISRDLSAALDVADAIHAHYRLEVGSPGLERALYSTADFTRFAGQLAKLKLHEPLDGQHVLRGTLHGLDESGHVLIETERGLLTLDYAAVQSARLVFDWRSGGSSKPRTSGRGRKALGPQGSR
jgi:ribosome maturation factor RimP